MRAIKLFTVVVLVIVVSAPLASCGLLGPTGAVSLCEAQLRAQCELAFRCCEAEERIGDGGFFAFAYTNTEGECVERATAICKLSGSTIDDSIGLQRTQFDSAKANECVAQLNQARDECDRGLAQRAALVCNDVFVGLVEDGDECSASSECAAGGFCDFGEEAEVNDELNALAGECLALPGDGDECLDGQCAAGLFCDGGTNECAALPGEGDDCNGFCNEGLFCNGDGECEAQKVDGEDCTDNDECLSAFCLETCGGDDIERCDGI